MQFLSCCELNHLIQRPHAIGNNFIDFVLLFFLFDSYGKLLGEHPAAMQRGAANANIDLSIVLYIVTLSMVLQQVNRLSHGYGFSYDVIRWIMSIRSKFVTSVQDDQHFYSVNFANKCQPNRNDIHPLTRIWTNSSRNHNECAIR